MLNKSTSHSEYVVQSIETPYPIGFAFQHNGDGTPQIRVTIGDMVAKENEHFVISEDSLSIKLLSLGENDKWVGAALVIERDIPFVQESDYQVGRISPEQIEKDFDLSVMRDQTLGEQIKGCTDGMQAEIDALHSRVDFVQEEHAADMAAVDRVMATKATKTELENAKAVLEEGIEGNADAILKTREDYQAADQDIRADMNTLSGEVTTLRTDHDDLGDQVAGIESKIPESASETNPLVTKGDLANIDLDGYVKKSGDTMTGDLDFLSDSTQWRNKITVSDNNGTLDIKRYNGDKLVSTFHVYSNNIAMSYSDTSILSPVALGNLYEPWDYVYTKKISVGANGADLNIPTEGGTLARLEDLEGLGGGDYLPLAGGTLEPNAEIGFVRYTGGTVHKLSVSSVNALATSGGFQCGKLYPQFPKYSDIGESIYSWRTIYVTKMNNGADLDVPTTGGTIARIEDIDAVVGDISTALTAILGE